VFAAYTVPLAGDGVPLDPAKINTALSAPFPFVQLIVVLVGAVFVNVTLLACVVGGFAIVVTLAGLPVAVEVIYCGLALVFHSTVITR